MRPNRKERLYNRRVNINLQIDKETIKEAIVESYQSIDNANNHSNESAETIKNYLCDLLKVIHISLIMMSCISFCLIIMYFINGASYDTIFIIAHMFLVSIFLIFLAIGCKKMWKSIEKETDKHYIVAYFSAIVSLVALIISFVAFVIST